MYPSKVDWTWLRTKVWDDVASSEIWIKLLFGVVGGIGLILKNTLTANSESEVKELDERKSATCGVVFVERASSALKLDGTFRKMEFLRSVL